MSSAKPIYRIVDWPLGEGEDDAGSYPNISTFTDRDEALGRAKELLTEYAESRASVYCDLTGPGSRPNLTAYTDAAVELGRFEEERDWYEKSWELSTSCETIYLTVVKTTKED